MGEALAGVDTDAKVLDVAEKAGARCSSKAGATVGWAYDSNPGICTNPKCCGNGHCTGVCAFGKTEGRTCDSKGGHYSRICPCKGGQSTTWKKFENFCVTADGGDFDEHQGIARIETLSQCQGACLDAQGCEAVEWSQEGHDGVKCFLMIGGEGAKGAPPPRHDDFECYAPE